MFEKFTDKARLVIVQAQEESRALNHDHVGTEHILLALVHDSRGTAVHVLTDLGISEDRVREQLNLSGAGRARIRRPGISRSPQGPRRPWNCRCGRHCSSATRTSVPSTCCSA